LIFVKEKKVINGDKTMLENYQVINESGAQRFAILDFSDKLQRAQIDNY